MGWTSGARDRPMESAGELLDEKGNNAVGISEICGHAGGNTLGRFGSADEMAAIPLKEMQMKRDIFISHRHDDKPIAEVLRKNILGWGISKDRIFLSSSVDNAPQIGGTLQDELQKALLEARVLFFLFTSSGANWDWCIYEIGLATDPTTRTRIVVLKCTDDPLPHVVKDEVVINMTKDDLKRLVKQFHKDKDFFPDQPAFDADINAGAMADRGERLFEELREVIPRESQREIIRQGDSNETGYLHQP